MAKVDPMEQLKAAAVGGPIAANEYVAAQSSLKDARQTALDSAAARSDSLQAPAAFRAAQAQTIAAPYAGDIQALGTQGAGAAAYSGAMSSAGSQYRGAVGGANDQNALRYELGMKNQGYEEDAMSSLIAQQSKAAAQAEKTKKEAEKSVKDENDARLEFSRQDAAANQDLQGDTFDTIQDTLSKSKDLDTALRHISSFTGVGDPVEVEVAGRKVRVYNSYQDKDGNDLAIDPTAVIAYTLKAYDPEAFAQELVAKPDVYAQYAK